MAHQHARGLLNQGGFTYLFVLLALTLLAFTLQKSLESIQIAHRQQQEAELLFRGEQIRQAIRRYKESGDGCFPVDAEHLLVDRRSGKNIYHLRQWYPDPMTGSVTWGSVYDPKGRWIGIYSQGAGRPLRKTGFGSLKDEAKFRQAKSYQEWVFAIEPDALAPLPEACKR